MQRYGTPIPSASITIQVFDKFSKLTLVLDDTESDWTAKCNATFWDDGLCVRVKLNALCYTGTASISRWLNMYSNAKMAF
jgi:hypothetical protein